MRKLHKITTILLIILLLFIQGIQPVISSAQLVSDNQFDLDIQVNPEATTEEAILTIKADESLDKVAIKLQDQSSYDQKKTEAILQNNVAFDYNAEEHVLTLEWQQDDTERTGEFILTNLEAEQNLLSATGFIEDEEVVEVQHLFNVQKQENESEKNTKESNQDTADQGTLNKEDAKTAKSEAEKEQLKSDSETDQVEHESETDQVEEEGKKLSVKAQSADHNLELYLNPLQDEVLSGKTANFQLDVKVTGSQTEYTNGELIVELPKHPEVPVVYPQIPNGVPDDSLTIAGVSPTYDDENGTLTYLFPELKSGQVYRMTIQAVPELGTTPVSGKGQNIRNLEANASLTVEEQSEALETGPKTTTVVSNGAISTSKMYTATKKYKNNNWTLSNNPPVQGDLGQWTINASIPKTAAGLTYIQENSKIRIVDQLPAGLSFDASLQEPGFSGVYDAASRTITWEFDAPTFEEQSQVETLENLFEKELTVNLRFGASIPNSSWVENSATASYEPIGGPRISHTATGSVMIASGGNDVPSPTGTWLFGSHFGAADGRGTVQTTANRGQVPTVTDDASLQFRVTGFIAPGAAAGNRYRINGGTWQTTTPSKEYHELIVEQGYRTYEIEYTIDDKLDLTHLQLLKPRAYYRNDIDPAPLNEIPETVVQLKINGVWTKEYPIEYPVGYGNNAHMLTPKFDVTQFGKNGHVEAFKVILKNASGKTQFFVNSFYDVYDGAVGRATNKTKTTFVLNNGRKVEIEPQPARIDEAPYGNRHVNIVQSKETNPTVQTAIQFVDGADEQLKIGSNIQRGNNRVQVEFLNTSASQDNVTGPIELVALLPKGVHILEQPNTLFSENSLNPTYEKLGEIDGQQQIKFTWDNKRLLPGEKVTASFDVDVTRTARANLDMQVYGYSTNTKLQVPASQGDVYTKSVLETDKNDLNKNGNTTEPRVKSANRYSIVKNDNLQITKQVKGCCDEDFSLFARTTPDGDVTYRFGLTNTTNEIIEQFMFLDVLPSVGDLGITDNKPRGSQFETTLKGPISFVGTKWEDQVDVYYSTSKNPKRDDLYATVDHSIGSTPMANPVGAEDPNWMLESKVTDWNKIHSFKIVMKEGVEWLEGQDIQFDVFAKAQPFTEDNLAIYDVNTPEVERAAWNSFAVTTNGLLAVEPLRVGVVMDLGSLEITKVDEETGEVLKGAKFELRDEEGNTVAEGTTDENGKLTFDHLPLGNYQLVETNAPEGYRLLTKLIDVEVTCDNLAIKINVENSKQGWILPETGGIGTFGFYLFGAILMIGALILLVRKKKTN